MPEHTYAIIMAGGGGTRLWPVSRSNRPKQLLPLIAEETLFQTTVQRLTGAFAPDHIYVVTVEDQAAELRRQAPHIPPENFLIEPAPRGTASVVGLAAAILHARDPQAVMCVLPSDHFIRNRDLFHLILRVAVDVARHDYLVTLGITPTYPATGYGYIQRGQPLPENFGYPVYRVQRFKEKPGESEAREMFRSGDYSWNSGMFIWKTERILAEIAAQMPDLSAALGRIAAADAPNRAAVIESVWPDLTNETIDYGIMEKASNVAVLPAGGLEWSDVGSWDSLFDVLMPDENGNIVFSGEHIALETSKSLVYGNRDGRLIVTIGVEDLIIVDAGDVLLVCHVNDAQKVRQVVSLLRANGRAHYT
ncbi:MAG: sugar phosphate nucleotidyltransferase [Anaerolineales bacterium]